MKNTYRVILLGLAVLGIVYASTGPEKKTQEVEKKTKETKYEPIDLCNLPVSIKVGHYIQIKECYKRKIELKQVACKSIGRDNKDFPCYKGSDTIKVKANFPAILNASLNKNNSDDNLLKDFNLHWENGINTIQGTGGWEELKLCLEAWDVDIYKYPFGTIKVGEIAIGVRPPDDPNDTELED